MFTVLLCCKTRLLQLTAICPPPSLPKERPMEVEMEDKKKKGSKTLLTQQGHRGFPVLTGVVYTWLVLINHFKDGSNFQIFKSALE